MIVSGNIVNVSFVFFFGWEFDDGFVDDVGVVVEVVGEGKVE